LTFGIREKWSYKTGDLLKEVQFKRNFKSMTGHEKGDLLIQATAWAGLLVFFIDNDRIRTNNISLEIKEFM
jgi:hypothetical protein